MELYSSNVVSKKEVDEVSMVGLSVAHRNARLLSAVGDLIAVNQAKFKNLLLVLREQPLLKDIVNTLKATYRSHLIVLLFLVLVGNFALLQFLHVVTRSYSSRPFLCALSNIKDMATWL